MIKRKTKRILSILIAVALGFFIVFLLALAGNKSRGPIENFLMNTGQAVQKMEQEVILTQRENKRADKLKWFEPIRSSRQQLNKPPLFLLGASDSHSTESYETIINLEDSLETTFPLIHIYNAWGSKPEEAFPKLQVDAILSLGSLPVITWEPWLSDFDEQDFPGIPPVEKRDKGSMAAIAKGHYDAYVNKWAAEAKKTGYPIFIRFGHEMNDPYRYPWGPQNNSPKEYVAAWKHVHDLFTKQDARNVIWIWGPHPSYGYFDAFYPGDKYVDYVGIGALNFGTVASWSKWWTFDEIFGSHYKELDKFKKPMMITEYGSLAVGGDRAKWFADTFDSLPQKYPSLRSIIFFHYSNDKTTTDKGVNWYIKNDPDVIKVVKEGIKKIK